MRIVVSIVAAVLTAAGAAGAGEPQTWRYPEAEALATGSPVLELSAADLSRAESEVSGRALRKGARLPEMRIAVSDAGGRAVPGVGVLLFAQLGKRSRNMLNARAVSGPDGVVLLRGAGGGFTRMGLDFEWGGRLVGAHFEPQGDGWSLVDAPYKDIVDRASEGSCANLFTLHREAPGAYRLDFRRPESLLECDRVEYGADRKTADLARLDAIGSRDLNHGDKNFFSQESERKMGLEAAAELDKELEFVDDPEIVGYLDGMLRRIVASSDEPEMPVRLRVVHTEDVNAFVTPGGNVYVFTGLISAARNESQLAGVLAHEASHAIARHGTEGATREIKTQVGTVLVALALGEALDLKNRQQRALLQTSLITAGVVGLRYGRRAETEADLLGSQYLWRAGWDPEGIGRFFEVLAEKGGPSPPGWLSTHPTHERRIQNGIQWTRDFLPPRERYLVDTAEFRRIQERVAALPEPRKQGSPLGGRSFMELMGATATFQNTVGDNLADILSGE